MKIYGKATDKNQKGIVESLRKCGIRVFVVNQGDDCPDLLCDWREFVLIEIKEPDGRLKRGQMRFLAESRGSVGVATDFETARRIAKDPIAFALNDRQKRRISQWLALNPGQESLSVRKFFEVIG